jgi:hypothetical protein
VLRRLAYVELRDDEKAAPVTGFVERALAFFAQHGIVARRLMTDTSFGYPKNRSLRELLARHGIRRAIRPANSLARGRARVENSCD